MSIFDFFKKKPEEKASTSQAEDFSTTSHVKSSQMVGRAMVPFHMSPLVTEKSTQLSALHQYSIQAPFTTTKTQVRMFLKDMLHVHPLSIRMVLMAGKHVRYGRSQGVTKKWKKYIVQLPATEKLEMQANSIH